MLIFSLYIFTKLLYDMAFCMYAVMLVLSSQTRSRKLRFLAGWKGSIVLFCKPFYKPFSVFLS